MELKNLEKRRDEIIGFNNVIQEQLKQLFETNTKLQEDYAKLIEQARINAGALSEVNKWIESIKKNGQETAPEEVKTVDTKSKK